MKRETSHFNHRLITITIKMMMKIIIVILIVIIITQLLNMTQVIYYISCSLFINASKVVDC